MASSPPPTEETAVPTRLNSAHLLEALVLVLAPQLAQAVEDQGRVAARAHADADGEHNLGKDERREAPPYGVNGQAERKEEGAQHQRPPAADDVGQVAGRHLQQQDRQVESGLDGEDLVEFRPLAV